MWSEGRQLTNLVVILYAIRLLVDKINHNWHTGYEKQYQKLFGLLCFLSLFSLSNFHDCSLATLKGSELSAHNFMKRLGQFTVSMGDKICTLWVSGWQIISVMFSYNVELFYCLLAAYFTRLYKQKLQFFHIVFQQGLITDAWCVLISM